MVFSSLLFLFRFLPLFLALYFLVPRKLRNGVLFIGSLIFYGWGEPVYISLLLFSTLVDFFHGKLVGRFLERGNRKAARMTVASSAFINLALLVIFMADLAFIMHSLAWLASNGTAAIVCFPGIMYRGGAEQKIRKYLVDNNFIDCIIQLPSNLFFGTSIATCIMVLKKGKTDNKVLFIDASSECVKVTNNNKLTPENINKIVDTFAQRAEEAHFSHLAEYSEVQENDYNLSVSTYVEAKDTREKIDIVKLNAEIAQIVARENELRAAIDQIVAEIEG